MAAPLRLLTIDLEDWFHLLDYSGTHEGTWSAFPSRVEANTERLLACFDRHGVKATFFVLGWVAERHPALLRKLRDLGHEIGTHSYAHGMVHGLSPEAFREDLRRSMRCIGEATGEAPRCYRAPGFSITRDQPWAFEILMDEGIEVDSSIFPGMRAHGGFPHVGWRGPALLVGAEGRTLKAMPITTAGFGPARVPAAGGGYFRLLPYTVTQALCARSDYLMTYFHPRDFDPGQPALPGLPWHRRFRASVGLGSALGKLDRLLAMGGFGAMGPGVASIDWTTVPRVPIGAVVPT